MTIIEKFESITTCADCCMAKACDPDTETWWCKLSPPHGQVKAWHRCDSGLWLARGAFDGSFYPVDLERYLRACADGLGRLEIIPRSEWPEAEGI
jgi:hypothetical protein